MYINCIAIRLEKNKFPKAQLPLAMSFTASSHVNTAVIVSPLKEVAPLFEELRQTVEASQPDSGFGMYLICSTPDTVSAPQSSATVTLVSMYSTKGPLSLSYTQKDSTDRISGQTDSYISLLRVFSYLVRPKATTKMAQHIAAPKQ